MDAPAHPLPRCRVLRSAAAIALLALGVALTVGSQSPSEKDAPPASVMPNATAARGADPYTPVERTAAHPESSSLPSAAPEGRIPDGYRIQIARLGIDLPVREGDLTRDIDEQRTPEDYAFHLPGTAIPGQAGNSYLYAHARRGMFLALWDARPGDEVIVRPPNGPALEYVVRYILPRVAPTDTSTTRPTATEQLTLQTSTGPSPEDPRFVVLAYPRGR